MIETNLTSYGYRQFDNSPIFHPHADEFWQKCIRDELSKLYYINLYKYDYSKHPQSGMDATIWQADVRFTRDNETWNIAFIVPKDYTIPMVETKIHEMWKNNNFDKYE